MIERHLTGDKRVSRRTTILIAIVSTVYCCSAMGAGKPLKVYIRAGQSNMEGQGVIEAQDKIPNARFKVMQAIDCPNLDRKRGQWYDAVPPLTQCWSGLSPADYFGKTLIEELPENITVGVINVSVGGCDIRLFDKDLYLDYDDTYTEKWFTDKIVAYEGNPYKTLMDLAKKAQKDGIIKGIAVQIRFS